MASDTFSPILGFLLQGTGNNNNTWGALLNTGDFDQIELAIAGLNAETVTGGTLNLSGSPPPAGPSGAIHAIITLSGTLTSNQIVQVPNLSKIWLVQNNTSGAFTTTFKTPSGTASTAIPQNAGYQMVICDGNNDIIVFPFNTNTIQMPDGSASTPPYSNINETNSGWYRHGTQDWRLSINGLDVLQVTGAGAGAPSIVNVLSPNALQVAGNGVPSIVGTPLSGNFALFASATTFKDSGAGSITSALLAPGAAPLPYAGTQLNDNLHILNDGTNATRDINITAGRVRDDSDATNLHLAATMFKRLDTAWAAGGASGSPAGACDTGTKGNHQTWHTFVIGKTGLAPTQYARSGTTVTLTFGSAHGLGAGGTIRVIGLNGTASGFDGIYAVASVTTTALTYTSAISGTVTTTSAPSGMTVDGFDVLASQSYSSPTMPSGWTVKQCLGSIITDGSANILAFTQVGDYFELKTPPLDVSAVSLTGSKQTAALTAPAGVQVRVDVNWILSQNNVANTFVYAFDPGLTDSAGASAAAPLAQMWVSGGGSATQNSGGPVGVYTNTSSQIALHSNQAVGSISLATLGWRDPRRRMF